MGWQKSAEVIAGRMVDEGLNVNWKEIGMSMPVEKQKSSVGIRSTFPKRPAGSRWVRESQRQSDSAITMKPERFMNRRIRNRTYGGVGGRGA
jgi:hypothetical protein